MDLIHFFIDVVLGVGVVVSQTLYLRESFYNKNLSFISSRRTTESQFIEKHDSFSYSYGTFSLMVFRGNCSRGRTGHMINDFILSRRYIVIPKSLPFPPLHVLLCIILFRSPLDNQVGNTYI